MSVKEAVLAALKELILPELQIIRQEQAEVKATLVLTNKRLDDVNAHLMDQSRRIDAIRDGLGSRIDAIQDGLGTRIDAIRDGLGARIDAVREELSTRIDDTNKRLDRLYEVIVRREEHHGLEVRVSTLEQEVSALKKGLAA